MLQIEPHHYPLPTGANARVRVDSVEETTTADGTEVTVVLTWADEHYAGHAVGGPERASRDFLVAEATLRALASVRGEPHGFALEDVSLTQAGGVDVLVAVVSDADGPGRPLVGTAVLDRDNARFGTVRAVLDAVNRRISDSR